METKTVKLYSLDYSNVKTYLIAALFIAGNINPEKPDVPLNKNDAFQKVQKRHVQEKR